MTAPQLVIFDCDGVLVDSEGISVAVLLDVIGRAGGKLSEAEAFDRFLGRSMGSVVGLLEEEFGFRFTEAHGEEARAALYARFQAELKPVPGVTGALRALKIPCCVASSSPVERIKLSLEVTGLLPLLDPDIFSAAMVKHGKPAPDLFLHAAAAMGVAPEHCVVVEDSPVGVEAAKKAGMRVFAFAGGSHAGKGVLRESLTALNPDLVFDDMTRLPTLLENPRADSSHPLRPSAEALVCAVDVGTGSARAGVFDRTGLLLGRAENPIGMNRPLPDHAEHDSEDIWRAACGAVREALRLAGAEPARIAGIAFDATCSLVVRDPAGEPVSVSTTGEERWDTIAWLDHRAMNEAEECTATGHRVLDFCGRVMSPEMQIPKLMWLKRHLPQSWGKAGFLFDLADFLSWKATGSHARSQCTLACKWTFLAHATPGWQRGFLEQVGLSDLLERGRLPERATPVGAGLGPLSPQAARALGLTQDCRVGCGLIDAYAGALGLLGGLAAEDSARHFALIAGTSSCVVAMSREPQGFAGAWGPYWGAALPDFWVSEGGQSATGALLDHVIALHGGGLKPEPATHRRIIARIEELREQEGPEIAPRLHVLPDFHGNRSPLADPRALGVVSGLSLDGSFDGLCRLYWRTAVGIALGLRHILEAIEPGGNRVETLHAAGGHARNPLLMQLYADATGCRVIEPAADEPVLLGTAMAAAAGAGLFPNLGAAGAAMRREGHERLPDRGARERLDRDYRIFLELHRHRRALDAMG